MSRIRPHVVVRRRSPNQSHRSASPRLIVIHSTESANRPGTGDLEAVAAWFARPESQVSSHVITDADGQSARCVKDGMKAWHCAGFNGVSLGIEQIGRAAQRSWTRDEVRETARWCARWSVLHNIPLRRGAVSNGSVTRSGIVRHMDLGSAGGGHSDPGPGYPLDDLIHLARFYAGKLHGHA